MGEVVFQMRGASFLYGEYPMGGVGFDGEVLEKNRRMYCLKMVQTQYFQNTFVQTARYFFVKATALLNHYHTTKLSVVLITGKESESVRCCPRFNLYQYTQALTSLFKNCTGKLKLVIKHPVFFSIVLECFFIL